MKTRRMDDYHSKEAVTFASAFDSPCKGASIGRLFMPWGQRELEIYVNDIFMRMGIMYNMGDSSSCVLTTLWWMIIDDH